jgi:cell division transport system permease protein
MSNGKNPAATTAKSRKPARKVRVAKRRLTVHTRQRAMLTKTRIMRYGVRNFTRNAWLTVAATAVMTITLLIIFATLMASSMLSETITAQRQKMDISLYFKAETSDDTLRNLAGKLRIIQNVASVDVSNSAAEYNKAVEANKNDPEYMSALSEAAANGAPMQLPAVIHVKLKDTDDRKAIDSLVANDQQFQEWVDTSRSGSDDVQIRENTVKRLSDIMTFAQKIGFGAAAIFVVISVLIIFNTIRMAIFSRREEIDMMKAIGADQHFIRGPFLIEAELYGIIAAVLATAIGYLTMVKILPIIGQYMEVSGTRNMMTDWFWLILLGIVALGVIIGDVSARLAVRRYLKP